MSTMAGLVVPESGMNETIQGSRIAWRQYQQIHEHSQ